MKKLSAGILLFRRRESNVEVFLVHPGGPFWAKKDASSWSIPKGEYLESDDPLLAAKREFEEETGAAIDGEFLALGEIKQAGGKIVTAWAVEGDLDPANLRSNAFQLEWPPKSGKTREFPEVDKWEWFIIEAAREKLLKGQVEFLDRLITEL
jgi:predicted NUDIX family NTP pyrophosphohydrolase